MGVNYTYLQAMLPTGIRQICGMASRQTVRNVAFYFDGRSYYIPLVKAGDYKDSNIRIRHNGSDYALAEADSSTYKTTTYDTKGGVWLTSGSPTCDLSQAGWCTFNGSSYIERNASFALKASDSFTFTTWVVPTTIVKNIAYGIIEFYLSSTVRIFLCINGDKKFSVYLNNTTNPIIVCSTTVTANTFYQLELRYNNGTFQLYVDNSLGGSASKSITAGNYTPYIGYSKAKSGRYFIGRIHQPDLTGAAEFFLPFGDN